MRAHYNIVLVQPCPRTIYCSPACPGTAIKLPLSPLEGGWGHQQGLGTPQSRRDPTKQQGTHRAAGNPPHTTPQCCSSSLWDVRCHGRGPQPQNATRLCTGLGSSLGMHRASFPFPTTKAAVVALQCSLLTCSCFGTFSC